MKYPRPNLIKDKRVPVVITALFDVCDKDGPKLLVLRRSDEVHTLKGHWSMPAGVIDNPIFRKRGACEGAALYQSVAELAGELFLFPEDIFEQFFHRRYDRYDPEKDQTYDTFLVVALTTAGEKVYQNWEHDCLQWFSVEELLSNLEIIPEPRTPNLLPDLESLKDYMESLF